MSRNETKVFGAPAKYSFIATTHYDWSGRGPHRCQGKFASLIVGRDDTRTPIWETGILVSWDKELPPIGEPTEVFAKWSCELYNGRLKDEYQMINSRPAEVPPSHVNVPLEGERGGGSGRGRMGPTPAEVQTQRMPAGATPSKYGPPDQGAYDLRDDQAPPPTDDDRGEWGF